MLIGKQVALSAISTSDAHSITIRGKDLCSELIGKMNFADFYYFLLTGQQATPLQSLFINATLVTIAEHGLTPTAQAARMTYDADPGALQAAVAAGILGAGSVVMGTSEVCGRMLHDIVETAAQTSASILDVTRAKLKERKENKLTVPGYGHPLHSSGDPRTRRLLEMATEHNVQGKHVEALLAIEQLLPEIYGRTLPINVSGTIPAVLLDTGFPVGALKGIPILARTAGLLGHLYEESTRPIGFLMYHHAEQAITYDGPKSCVPVQAGVPA
ncbi:citryl-CoA lyase [Candidimonas sp. SYP-B2681]|uniref:citryl-CoA lyase n=1 Tax=Candidimonas sp. SYP-B2681 TaxID=2497686 RepID=UPI000F881B9A|nr:citryl-CoA lyase [Candidimonas sp. SYP-B2681]RTZ43208.1 citryl-CoA lyase [Candidimonas sp. SYP-B2681]